MPPVWKPIKEIIKKPIKWIGDTIEDIGDWVVDEIIDPVVSTVEGTIDALLDDPIKTIATTAAVIYGQDPVEAFLKGGIQAGVSAGLGQLSENTDYQKLPQAAKNVIETSLTATLSGQDVTPAMIAGAVTKAYVTTEAVSNCVV